MRHLGVKEEQQAQRKRVRNRRWLGACSDRDVEGIETASLCWPGAYYVAQAGLMLTKICLLLG